MSESRNFLRFISFIGVIIGVLLIAAILLSSTCKAQTYDPQKTLTIFGFKGLGTALGTFGATPDYAVKDNNTDHSRYGIGTIGKRWGFDSVGTITGIDSVVGLGTYQRSNRQSCLVYAVDDSTKGYGAIWATRYGSEEPDSARKIKDYWSIQNPTRFSQFNDNLYATNGQQQGVVWNGTRVRNFPVNTPGMPDIIPLNTSGNLNGEYRYCIWQAKGFKSGTAYTFLDGTLSSPVRISSGKTLLRNFTKVIADSIMTSVDSAYAYIGRTKANPGPIDDEDTLWLVDSVCLRTSADTSRADTVTYTDNIADASLTRYVTVSTLKTQYGRDTTGAIVGRRFGAPTFISSDSTNASTSVIYPGSLYGAQNILGYAYIVTVADTILGLESDSTRSLRVRCKKRAAADSTTTLRRITIGLPRLNKYDSGFMFNIYRASLLTFGRKYIAISPNGDTIWEAGGTVKGGNVSDVDDWIKALKNGGGYRIDSLKSLDFYRCAQVPTSQVTYVDSIRTDTLYVRNRRYNISVQPDLFSQIVQWRGKLCGVAGSRIWESNYFVDSQRNFGNNEFDDFNRNDGDFITSVKEAQFGLKVKKNRTSYVLPNGGGRPEKISSFGCVAPLSYISTDAGDMFVGDGGVYLETEGQQLERIYNSGLISEKIDNFTKLSAATRRNIAGFWIPDKQQAIFSAGDTAYIYDKKANAWSTWTVLVPRFGCLYSTNSTLGSPPPSTFYFTKAGGKVLYRYATVDYDVGITTMCPMTYETVPLFTDSWNEVVDAVGLTARNFYWNNPDPFGDAVAYTDAVLCRLYDLGGNALDTAITFDSLSVAFATLGVKQRYKEMGAIDAPLQSLRITTIAPNNQIILGGIEAIDILYRRVEKVSAK